MKKALVSLSVVLAAVAGSVWAKSEKKQCPPQNCPTAAAAGAVAIVSELKAALGLSAEQETAIRATLTPEQQAKWDALQASPMKPCCAQAAKDGKTCPCASSAAKPCCAAAAKSGKVCPCSQGSVKPCCAAAEKAGVPCAVCPAKKK